jgi:hypothetical protein
MLLEQQASTRRPMEADGPRRHVGLRRRRRLRDHMKTPMMPRQFRVAHRQYRPGGASVPSPDYAVAGAGSAAVCSSVRLPVHGGLQYIRKRVGHALACECALAGEHFIEDACKRPYVGPFIDCVSSLLFGTHIGGSTHDNPSLGDWRR